MSQDKKVSENQVATESQSSFGLSSKQKYIKPAIKSEVVSRAGLHTQVCNGSGHFGSKESDLAGCSPLLS